MLFYVLFEIVFKPSYLTDLLESHLGIGTDKMSCSDMEKWGFFYLDIMVWKHCDITSSLNNLDHSGSPNLFNELEPPKLSLVI